MSRRARSWRPPRGATFVPPKIDAAPASPVEHQAWQRWAPEQHIACARPPCQHRGCPKTAMQWNRCRCGAVFALCGDHGQVGQSWREREAHMASSPTCQMGQAAGVPSTL